MDGLSTIEQTLKQHGWQIIHSKSNVQTVLGRFTNYKPEHHLALFPWLYRSKPPVLFMIQHLPHATTIIEPRLWKSGVRFKDATLPLWVGSINYHLAPKHLITLHRPHEITRLNGGGINQLIPTLSGYQWRKLQIHPSRKSKKIQPIPDLDRTLLLIRSQEGGIYPILLKIN